ncbi:MAG: c-type cytochrome, partial [Sphingobacteriales bacterium]
GLELNTTNGVLNYDATDLFAADAINLSAFPKSAFNGDQQALADLGKQLFSDKRLSGNQQVNCASCHRPEYYFSEPQEKSSAFDGHSFVKRNAPTLLYSAYQYEQFWDGRAKSLEQQIQMVIDNPAEMNGHEAAAGLLQKASAYTTRFDTLFARQPGTLNVSSKIAMAIAAYIRQLNPMNARFDQYLRGNEQLLNASEKNGFNLFMGKAQCGTCHFAPLFNGLVPPLYNLSELEVIGTLKTDKLDRPMLDDDKGRIEIFPIEYYDRSFKTPTVRNVSATAPYMHNGAFHTLDAVVEFYNKGGAAGLGLSLPNQTLAAVPLQLSKQEVKDVVNFLHALKDSIDLSTLKTYNNR